MNSIRQRSQNEPSDDTHDDLQRDIEIFVLPDTPQHFAAVAEGRPFILICPDEPVPENPIL